MKKSLSHLPLHKKAELKRITEIIRSNVSDLVMVILYGSYARGTWVEDTYQEGHITYSYKSDYDIFIITEKHRSPKNVSLKCKIEREIKKIYASETRTSLIFHDIKEMNNRIAKGSYFFTDIKKEGIMLYDSGKYKLERVQKLNPELRQQYAREDFKQWFKSAKSFFIDFGHALDRRDYKKAAFELHQATERTYHAILLSFTGYKPKIHDIDDLGSQVNGLEPAFIKIFPKTTKEEKRLYELLRSAYIDARYNNNYKIKRKELEYLAGRVKKFQALTKKVCKAKIESFTSVS